MLARLNCLLSNTLAWAGVAAKQTPKPLTKSHYFDSADLGYHMSRAYYPSRGLPN